MDEYKGFKNANWNGHYNFIDSLRDNLFGLSYDSVITIQCGNGCYGRFLYKGRTYYKRLTVKEFIKYLDKKFLSYEGGRIHGIHGYKHSFQIIMFPRENSKKGYQWIINVFFNVEGEM